MAEKSDQNQPRRGAGRRFPPGKSGNPAGKPAGTRNKTTIAVEALLEGEAEALTRQCIDLAKGGDGMALRLCMERIAPLRRGRPVRFTLPTLDGPGDLVKALGGILHAVADGDLTPDEAATVAGILDAKRRAHETTQLEDRLSALEKGTSA